MLLQWNKVIRLQCYNASRSYNRIKRLYPIEYCASQWSEWCKTWLKICKNVCNVEKMCECVTEQSSYVFYNIKNRFRSIFYTWLLPVITLNKYGIYLPLFYVYTLYYLYYKYIIRVKCNHSVTHILSKEKKEWSLTGDDVHW